MYNNDHPIPEGEFCEGYDNPDDKKVKACRNLKVVKGYCEKLHIPLSLGASYETGFMKLLYKKNEECEPEKAEKKTAKKCYVCCDKKGFDQFNIDNASPDGRQRKCKSCTRKYYFSRKVKIVF